MNPTVEQQIEVMSSPWKDNPVVLDVPKRSLHEYRTDYEKHLKATQKAAGKTTESILKLCRVVFEASVALDETEFKKFRKEHKQLKSGSMVSNIKKIGANAERLGKWAESLPSSWYSLYLLSGIEDDSVIEHAIKESKTLHPLTTQRDIARLIIAATQGKADDETDENTDEQHECSFTIDIFTHSAFDVSEFQTALDAFLEEQKKSFGWNGVVAKQAA